MSFSTMAELGLSSITAEITSLLNRTPLVDVALGESCNGVYDF